jgi:hypothetical protein
MSFLANPREHLLTNGANKMGSPFADKLPELQRSGVLGDLPSTQGQGPDAGIDQHVHPRLRCSL